MCIPNLASLRDNIKGCSLLAFSYKLAVDVKTVLIMLNVVEIIMFLYYVIFYVLVNGN